MARLPTVEWPERLVEQRIDFLRAAALFVPPAFEDEPDQRYEANRRNADAPVQDVHALLTAVDIALSTDRTRAAVGWLNDAVDTLVGRGNLHAAALPGAILGRIVTTLRWDDVQIEDRATGRSVSAPYPPKTPIGLQLMSDLVFASVGSDAPVETFEWFDGASLPSFRTGDPVVLALAPFDIQSPNPNVAESDRFEIALSGLIANSAQWRENLRLQQLDQYHWERALLQGPLIDMRRLAFELALLRRPEVESFRRWRSERSLGRVAGDLDRFAATLAGEIVEVLRR